MVKKGEMKLSGLSIFCGGNTRKSISSSNLKVSLYDLPIVTSEFQFQLRFNFCFWRSLASNLSAHLWEAIDSFFPILTVKDNYRHVLWRFNVWDCSWNEFLMFPFKSNILGEVVGLVHERIFFPLNFFFGCFCMAVKEGVRDCMNKFSRKYPGYQRFFSPWVASGRQGRCCDRQKMFFAQVTRHLTETGNRAWKVSGTQGTSRFRWIRFLTLCVSVFSLQRIPPNTPTQTVSL